MKLFALVLLNAAPYRVGQICARESGRRLGGNLRKVLRTETFDQAITGFVAPQFLAYAEHCQNRIFRITLHDRIVASMIAHVHKIVIHLSINYTRK